MWRMVVSRMKSFPSPGAYASRVSFRRPCGPINMDGSADFPVSSISGLRFPVVQHRVQEDHCASPLDPEAHSGLDLRECCRRRPRITESVICHWEVKSSRASAHHLSAT